MSAQFKTEYHDFIRDGSSVAAIRSLTLRTGHVPNYLIYDDPANWLAVAADPAYGQHDVCLATLIKFLESGPWRDHVASIETFIDLGVGTGEKIGNFIATDAERLPNRRLNVFLIDVNKDLLQLSEKRIKAIIGTNCAPSVHLFRARFDQLSRIMSSTGSKIQGVSAFLVLGNTFANLHEEAFLRRLSRNMRSGDLFVLSLEFASVGHRVNNKQDIMASYTGSAAIQRLFSSSLRYFPDASELEIVAAQGDARFSSIPRTFTVAGRFRSKGRELFSAHSNRYHFEAFVRFVQAFDLTFVSSFNLKETPFYKYVVFERI